MAMPGQLQGGENSALEVVIGQEDYTYRFSNNAMWLDTQGYAGQGDYLSVLVLDNYDLGITRVEIEPSVTDPATFQSIVGEGNRWVNVTVKNTGLMPISSGSFDVDLEVREVLGGTDTVVYFNDFETDSPTLTRRSYPEQVLLHRRVRIRKLIMAHRRESILDQSGLRRIRCSTFQQQRLPVHAKRNRPVPRG